MHRQDLHHVVAAAAQIVGEEEWVVIGSQAILGPFPDAPAGMLRSMEADLYPRAAPEKATLVEGVLGDGSRFHETYGYYAHAVAPETARAPAGWEDRQQRRFVRLDQSDAVPDLPDLLVACVRHVRSRTRGGSSAPGIARSIPRSSGTDRGRPAPSRILQQDLRRIMSPSLVEFDPGLPPEITRRTPLARAWRDYEHVLAARIADAAIRA